MNEFIEQFVLESRDHIEQASTGLLTLERVANDAEALDSTFRAFHTLKGGASIVEFAAMERAFHAAEDVLSHARSGKNPLTRALIASCMECLDQAARWLDRMEASGEVPAGADAEANNIIQRISSATQSEPQAVAAPATVSVRWIDAALQSNPHLQGNAQTALTFTPRAASFFQSIDPLALVASAPGLLWFDAAPINDWPTLEDLDPFESLLVLKLLSSASPQALSAHFSDHSEACSIVTIAPRNSTEAGLPAAAWKLIEAQVALLGSLAQPTFIGRVTSAGRVIANALRHCGSESNAALIAQATETSVRAGKADALLQQIATLRAPAAQIAADAPEPNAAGPHSARSDAPIARILKVNAERVDALVRLTGELLVAKNAIGHLVTLAQTENSSLHRNLKDQHGALDHLVGELQRAVLGIRVLPLRTVLQRFPRVIRDLSAGLGKPARLVIEGENTEADKTIVESLFEPLLHIVRNAMDHGIETAAVRAQRNKPAVASIRMQASRAGANVLVEIADDGGGIDVARVRAVALERGVVSSDALAAMSDDAAIDLIFAAGFSTAARVTEFSGRGVGMDVVRTAIEAVGGRVTIQSRPAQGTTVSLLLPFSVMMSHVMTVEAGGQMFGVPLDAVVETVRIPTAIIAGIGAAKAFVHRNRTLPVLELATLLQVAETTPAQPETTLVITSVAGHLGGLQVDRIGERMEVMLKPLDGLLSGVPGLAGTTILGDGRVLLVLDLNGVMQ